MANDNSDVKKSEAEDNFLNVLQNYQNFNNTPAISSTENGINIAIEAGAKLGPVARILSGKGWIDSGVNVTLGAYNDVENNGESPLQAVISNGVAGVASYAVGSIAVAMAATGTPIGIVAGAYILANSGKIYQGTDELVDAAYKYADEVWREKTGESIEQTANRLYQQYEDGMLESVEAQEKLNAELTNGIKGLVNSTKEAITAEEQKVPVGATPNGIYHGYTMEQVRENMAKFLEAGSNKGRDGLPDPLAIDLDGDGLETVSRSDSSAYFDLDKNGMAEKTGWISGDDGILTRDINGDSVVNDSSELFGDKTALGGGGVAASGFNLTTENTEDTENFKLLMLVV